jgi:polar amino acid transport system substrate-binding protein
LLHPWKKEVLLMEEKAEPPSRPATSSRRRHLTTLVILLLNLHASAQPARPDTLDEVRKTHRLVYGSDEEGGAPYIYLNRTSPPKLVGFEVEMMDRIARAMNAEAVFSQALWENLLQVLDRGEVQVVVNGYELTERRVRDFLPTRPYYVYQLQLMTRPDGPLRSIADLSLPRPGGGLWQVGVLGNSAADTFAQRFDARLVRVDGATNAMMKVRSGQIDATLQDLPAAHHYTLQPEFQELKLAGPPEGCGYYVMYVRKGDDRLRDALDDAIGLLTRSGELKAIFEKYHVWNDAQTMLDGWSRGSHSETKATRPWFDFALLRDFLPALLASATTTLLLSFGSMPIAIIAGLGIALGRIHGPRWLATLLGVYVEAIRGTPLMLQLFVLFYVLPELGILLSPWVAGIAGLAINYSAYEAEIYRAGLQAVPRGQMEAGLALGMSRGMAIRRVVVPQAVRIVIPPVTSDFIALFKDTSVCSVLTLTELTKRYSILSNSVGGVVEFGLATALLYLAMSLPLSWFSRWMERRLDPDGKEG